MLRTLFSGITGLKNHQTQMDVLGNNIANANTTGFKTGRALFEDNLSQTITGATRPGGMGEGMGGTNATQIGMGSSVATVQTLQNQGNLQSTGQTTDLALEGDGYFVVSDGKSQYYTRDGSMALDATGHLVTASGLVLQGIRADDTGTISTSQDVDPIVIPLSTCAPASPTTEISFSRNLNADSTAEGSIVHSDRFLTHSSNAVPIVHLRDDTGNSLGIRDGDTLTFHVLVSGTETRATFPVTASTTFQQLMAGVETFLRNATGSTSTTVTRAASGAMSVSAGTTIRGLQISSDRAISNSVVMKTFAFPSTIASSATADSVPLRCPATTSTPLRWTFDSRGNALGLENGDVISIAGAVGGKTVTPSSLVYNPATTTMSDVLVALQNQLGLPRNDGTVQNHPTVSINARGSDDNLPDGSIVIRGMPGTTFALTDISIRASNSNNSNPSPGAFNTNMSFTEFQSARDTQIARTSIVTYDDAGYAHTVDVAFIPSQTPDKWLWEASVDGDASIVAGHRGTLTFGPDGTVSNFAYQDGSRTLQIDPRNGAGVMSIRLNPGSSGQFSGLTQFAAPTTAVASKQDGYTMGQLQSIAVSSDGVVQGFFDNGTARALAKILIAQFTNPSGLVAVSGNAFAASANSGDPVLVDPATGACSIKPGTLEMSNVEISREFANLIVTQRGYQANARVVSQADGFLEEVVNLVR